MTYSCVSAQPTCVRIPAWSTSLQQMRVGGHLARERRASGLYPYLQRLLVPPPQENSRAVAAWSSSVDRILSERMNQCA